nr:MAG TPA: hypothetical protein [Caudoviricetes sp.]
METELIPKNQIVSKEELTDLMPKKMKGLITDETVKMMNDCLVEPEMAKIYRENLISYSGILKDGGYSLERFFQAIKYCSYKLGGMSNQEAWMRTFPDRYQKHISAGKSLQEISVLVHSWNKSKLVTKIQEQALVPSWILNNDIYQEAVNMQAHIMRTAKSEKVRSDAANSLLNHLKPPETSKIQLDIGQKTSQHIQELRDAIKEYSDSQLMAIKSGNADAKLIAESVLVRSEDEQG